MRYIINDKDVNVLISQYKKLVELADHHENIEPREIFHGSFRILINRLIKEFNHRKETENSPRRIRL